MDDRKRMICRPNSTSDGPTDGVMIKTDCIRTDFFQSPNENGALYQQREKSEASITASMELGVFSIRDRQSDVMLTVSLLDAMEILAEATDTEKKEDAKCREQVSANVHTAEKGYCS